ncbi:hypothetical protein QL996_14225 [Planococcus sp. APC 4015]|nr:hypothetical protein [Planococcus sp. APC 4015]
MSGQSPRRRHSPAVYRRRRIVLLVGIIVVAAVVWLLIAQPWRGSATSPDAASSTPAATQAAATDLPVPNATAGAQPTESATAPPAEGDQNIATPTAAACAEGDVTVEGLTDQDSYGSGQNPQLSIRLTNNGTADCTMNVGTTTQVFTLTSGDDVWWRSTDCQTEPSDMLVLLAAGQSVTSAAPLTWDRTRSAVGSCDAPDRATAPGGGASYHLAVEIGGISSSQSKQLLLY